MWIWDESRMKNIFDANSISAFVRWWAFIYLTYMEYCCGSWGLMKSGKVDAYEVREWIDYFIAIRAFLCQRLRNNVNKPRSEKAGNLGNAHCMGVMRFLYEESLCQDFFPEKNEKLCFETVGMWRHDLYFFGIFFLVRKWGLKLRVFGKQKGIDLNLLATLVAFYCPPEIRGLFLRHEDIKIDPTLEYYCYHSHSVCTMYECVVFTVLAALKFVPTLWEFLCETGKEVGVTFSSPGSGIVSVHDRGPKTD